tara:strand:+ start:13213 stop:13809 length:597 start_codon:yes stop_codon:yes gene_type:complete
MSATEVSAYALAHEMGHVVEQSEDRFLLPSYDMKPTRVQIIGGRSYPEVSTAQATERELRVHAIQHLIQDHCGLHEEPGPEYSAVLWQYMVDHWAFAEKAGGSWTEKEKVSYYAEERIRALMAETTIDEVWAEWVRKCEIHDSVVGLRLSEIEKLGYWNPKPVLAMWFEENDEGEEVMTWIPEWEWWEREEKRLNEAT